MAYYTIFSPPDSVVAKWPKPTPLSRADDIRHVLAPLVLPFFGLAYFVVILRLFARIRVKALGLDDLLMVLSLVPTTFASIVGLNLRNSGLGLHMWDAKGANILTPRSGEYARWGIYTFTLCLSIGHVLTRFSVLISLYRVFANAGERRMRVALHSYLTFLVITSPVIIITDMLQCIPIQAFWDLSVENPNCSNQKGIMMLGRILSCVCNFWLFALPLQRLWKIQVPYAQRIGLVVVFGFGFVVCILSLFKMFFLIKVLYFNPQYDYTWLMFPVQVACSLENSLTVICGSAPLLRYYFNKVKAVTSTKGSSTSSSKYTGASSSSSRPSFKKGHSSTASEDTVQWTVKTEITSVSVHKEQLADEKV